MKPRSETKDYLDSMAVYPVIKTEKTATVLAFALCAMMYGMLFLTSNLVYFIIGNIMAFVGFGALMGIFGEKDKGEE